MTANLPALQPHPYALLLPPLTAEEYAALKADIEATGILYPVIVDEDRRVLDGVHRVRIAGELGIEPPLSQMGHLDDERKLHLAVGLNMRRRHLDADRRRELVRRLHTEEGLSVRKLAAVTGWSKSTVDRDLKTSPFEETLNGAKQAAEEFRGLDFDDNAVANALAETATAFGRIFGYADQQWKRGTWPPPPEEHLEMTLTYFDIGLPLEAIRKMSEADSMEERERLSKHYDELHEQLDDFRTRWEGWSPEKRQEVAERTRHLHRPRVPSGTDTDHEEV